MTVPVDTPADTTGGVSTQNYLYPTTNYEPEGWYSSPSSTNVPAASYNYVAPTSNYNYVDPTPSYNYYNPTPSYNYYNPTPTPTYTQPYL